MKKNWFQGTYTISFWTRIHLYFRSPVIQINGLLQYIQYISNGDTAVLHWAIDIICLSLDTTKTVVIPLDIRLSTYQPWLEQRLTIRNNFIGRGISCFQDISLTLLGLLISTKNRYGVCVPLAKERLIHCSLRWYHKAAYIWVDIGKGDGIFPDSNKPLPELIMTYDHKGSAESALFTLDQFHRSLIYQSIKCVLREHF